MAVVLAAVAILVVLVGLLQTGVLYHALGRVWAGMPPERRRPTLILCLIGFPIGGGLAALGIAAPWGPDTIAYEMCGVAALAIVFGLLGAAVAARQDLRRARQHRDSDKHPDGSGQPLLP